jgi:hypothetical protein
MNGSMTKFSAAWFALVGIACVQEHPIGEASGPADEFIAAFCDLYKPCCAKTDRPTDGAQCRRLYKASAAGETFNQASADSCLAQLRNQASDPAFCSGDGPESCEEVFAEPDLARGTKLVGEECEEDGECVASSEGEVVCNRAHDFNVDRRWCQVRVRGKEGSSPCVATREDNATYYLGSDLPDVDKGYECWVEDGLWCNGDIGACVPPVAAGGSCESTIQCVKGAYCDFKISKCVQRKPLEAKCDTDLDDPCTKDAHCDSATKTCAARLPDGAPCSSHDGCLGNYCRNNKCGYDSPSVLDFYCGPQTPQLRSQPIDFSVTRSGS